MKRKLLLTAGCGLVFGLVAAGFWQWGRPEKDLDSIATQICRFQESHAGRDVIRYHWLSESEILEQWENPTEIIIRFARVDPLRGTSRELSGLLAAVRKLGAGSVVPSPDGKWFLSWRVTLRPKRTERLLAISENGRQAVIWPPLVSVGGDVLNHGWMPDSRTYLVLYTTKIVLYRIDEPGKPRRYRIPVPRGFSRVVQDGVIAVKWPKPGRSALLTRIALTADVPTIQRSSLRLPDPSTVRMAELSPRGDRIVWLLGNEDQSAFSWLDRLLTKLGRRPHKRFGLWVSNLDGSRLREIGHVHDKGLESIRWAPGGKKLSFVRKGFVYTVPVDD